MKNIGQRIYAWSVHALTTSGLIVGFLTLLAIEANNYKLSLAYMVLAVIIDGIDGTLARRVDMKALAPIDGALLDNVIDFVNYSFVPCFFIYKFHLLGAYMWPGVVGILVASCYQFTRVGAKTKDNFFLGFPSYWNLVVGYQFYWQLPAVVNFIIIFICVILSFVPIRFIYPTRLGNLTNSVGFKIFFSAYAWIWALSTFMQIYFFPHIYLALDFLTISFFLLYVIASVYRHLFPLQLQET